MNKRIKLLRSDELNWDFSSKNPTFKLVTPNCKYPSWIQGVDVKPAYTHNLELVEKEVEKVEKLFPIKFKPYYFINPFDTESRTNGYADKNTIYNDNERTTFDSIVVLHGKTIPIHPAMTRYLIAHEYGHCVDNWICYCKNYASEKSVTQFDIEYAKIRRVELSSDYGPGKWHKNIGEIIANDFRICVCNSEPEFWPHEIEHPHNHKDINDYWYQLMLEFSYRD